MEGMREETRTDAGAVEIRINGEMRKARSGISVAELLEELEIDRRGVVVEHNREILRGSEIEETSLESGDRLEIVQFVGGG